MPDTSSAESDQSEIPEGKRKVTKAALACRRCRERKIKCDLQTPCHNCVKLGIACVPKTEDLRKKRHTIEYVQSLENQVGKLEALVARIQADRGADPSALLNAIVGEPSVRVAQPEPNPSSNTSMKPSTNTPEFSDSHTPSNVVRNIPFSPKNSNPQPKPTPFDNFPKLAKPKNPSPREFESSIRTTNIRSVSVYGPTSIYDSNYLAEQHKRRASPDSPDEPEDGPTLFQQGIQKLGSDSDIVAALKLFFVWQYPDHNMFVYREAFLVDFFHPKPNSVYVSEELVYSIAALGAKMGDPHLQSKSRGYYETAKHQLLNYSFDSPAITSVQAFLCLAFYDICDGNNASGWMLSGNSFRMGYDLGFQLDPAHWFVNKHEEGLVSSINVNIRSRIYWGCYMADHFISLLLGRPSLINVGDATIPESKDLPDVTGMEQFLYSSAHPEHSFISTPLKCMTNLIALSEEILSEIFNKNREGKGNESLLEKVKILDKYNVAVRKWREELPVDIAWSKNDVKHKSYNPTIMSLRYYYYIILLCINRPFVAIYPKAKGKDDLSPASIVSDVMNDLQDAIFCFKQKHSLAKASIFIVYSAILSISIILLTGSRRSVKRDSRLAFFLSVLKDTSGTWKLAEKSHKLIKSRLDRAHPEAKTPDNREIPVDQGMLPRTVSPRFPTANTREIMLTGFEPKAFSPAEFAYKFTSPSPFPGKLEEDASGYPSLDDSVMASLGGPPLLMTSDMFNEDWESLFPDYLFTANN